MNERRPAVVGLISLLKGQGVVAGSPLATLGGSEGATDGMRSRIHQPPIDDAVQERAHSSGCGRVEHSSVGGEEASVHSVQCSGDAVVR